MRTNKLNEPSPREPRPARLLANFGSDDDKAAPGPESLCCAKQAEKHMPAGDGGKGSRNPIPGPVAFLLLKVRGFSD